MMLRRMYTITRLTHIDIYVTSFSNFYPKWVSVNWRSTHTPQTLIQSPQIAVATPNIDKEEALLEFFILEAQHPHQ